MQIYAYLTFNGNCREAMTFYKSCIGGGQLDLMTFADAPGSDPAHKDKIMHAKLSHNDFVLMASDGRPGTPVKIGENVHLSVDCKSRDEMLKVFNALAEKGKVTMPPEQQFWGAFFGMLTDRYGVHWMFNCETKKA